MTELINVTEMINCNLQHFVRIFIFVFRTRIASGQKQGSICQKTITSFLRKPSIVELIVRYLVSG